jgi:Bacterial SH3 domain
MIAWPGPSAAVARCLRDPGKSEMKRLIIVSFAFLGWAFYLLSGGSEFTPPVDPGEQSAKTSRSGDPAALSNGEAPSGAGPVQAVALVARPAIAPQSARRLSPVLTPAPPRDAPPEPAIGPTVGQARDQAFAARDLDQVRSSLSQGLTLFPEASPEREMTLASLAQGTAGLRETPVEPPPPEVPAMVIDDPAVDIREVVGTRVNMRDGPGTIYPVIARLSIGNEVEVLGESGTGWLRLRSLPERQIGWIAASLISKAVN